eukprot:894166-Lingulodinium_polyedra.AAC.1
MRQLKPTNAVSPVVDYSFNLGAKPAFTALFIYSHYFQTHDKEEEHYIVMYSWLRQRHDSCFHAR